MPRRAMQKNPLQIQNNAKHNLSFSSISAFFACFFQTCPSKSMFLGSFLLPWKVQKRSSQHFASIKRTSPPELHWSYSAGFVFRFAREAPLETAGLLGFLLGDCFLYMFCDGFLIWKTDPAV